MSTCLWFAWIGGPVCDRCGKSLSRHLGLDWRGEEVEWADYGPGRYLDVPLLTHCIAPDDLAYLQSLSGAS